MMATGAVTMLSAPSEIGFGLCCDWFSTLGAGTGGVGDDGGWIWSGTGGGLGTERCKSVVICWIASRVESPIERHGAAICGKLRMERRSCTVFRRKSSVVSFGKGTVSGNYWTKSAIRVLFVAGIKHWTQR